MKTQFKNTLKIIIIALVIGVGVSYINAYTPPACSPPNCNTPAPINVSANGQSKIGWMWINGTDASNNPLARSLTVQNGQVQIGTTSANTNLLLAVAGHVALTGNLGIGNTNPTAKVDIGIKSSDGAYPIALLMADTPSNSTWFGAIPQCAGCYAPNALAGDFVFRSSNNKNFRISTDGGSSNAFNVLTNGNVGIGTGVPAARLSVAGGALSQTDSASYGVTTTMFQGNNQNAGVGYYGGIIGTNVTLNGNAGANRPMVVNTCCGINSGTGAAISLSSDPSAVGKSVGIWVGSGTAGTNLTERLSVNSTGQVRIGSVGDTDTTDPTVGALHVEGVGGVGVYAHGYNAIQGVGQGTYSYGVLGQNDGGGAVFGQCTGGNCNGVIGWGTGTGSGGAFVNGVNISSGGLDMIGNLHIGSTNAGAITVENGKVTAKGFINSSDERLKKDIQPLPSVLGLVSLLNPVTFNWKDAGGDPYQAGTQYGFLAQEVEKIFPSWVSTSTNGYKGINYNNFASLSIKGIQELSVKVDDQAKEIETLKSQNAQLESRLEALENKIK